MASRRQGALVAREGPQGDSQAADGEIEESGSRVQAKDERGDGSGVREGFEERMDGDDGPGLTDDGDVEKAAGWVGCGPGFVCGHADLDSFFR